MDLIKNILFFIVLFSVSTTSLADNRSKREKLLKLAEFEDLIHVTKRTRELCVKVMRKVTPDIITLDNPEYFGGIKPGSKYWNDVKEIYYIYKFILRLSKER